jgi:hypothetical protein
VAWNRRFGVAWHQGPGLASLGPKQAPETSERGGHNEGDAGTSQLDTVHAESFGIDQASCERYSIW